MPIREPLTDGISAVIFDLAGTTVDYGSPAPAKPFVALFARHGVQISVEEARGPMGTRRRDHITALLAPPHPRRMACCGGCGADGRSPFGALRRVQGPA